MLGFKFWRSLTTEWRSEGKEAVASGRGHGVLPRFAGARRAGASRHGGGSAVPVVPAVAGRVRARAVGGRCGAHSGGGGGQEEDGPAGCRADPAADAWRSGFRGSGCRRRRSAMCGSCCWTGIIACGRGPRPRTSCKPLALNQGVQKGRAAVDGGGAGAAGESDDARARGTAAGPVAAVGGGAGPADRGAGRAGAAEVRAQAGRRAVDDASRGGAADGAGHGADAGRGESLCTRRGQVASYLGLVPSEYSSGGKQRLGHISKQGSSSDAVSAGGSGPDGGARATTSCSAPTSDCGCAKAIARWPR